ncbi:MAG TPA: hypothetical protein VK959_09775 [Methylophilaceae bacterium]|jgi:uncharacterized protein YqgC (DUF456 family)|nr:hypothetical protein [Methylophilaceae bacterium]
MARPLPGKKEVAKGKPESLISVIKAIGQFVLIVIGIIGTTILIFSSDGLLATMGGKLLDLDSTAFVGIALALVVLYVAKVWFEKTFGKSSAAVSGSLAMYLMMAVGAFFLYRLISTGSFTG